MVYRPVQERAGEVLLIYRILAPVLISYLARYIQGIGHETSPYHTLSTQYLLSLTVERKGASLSFSRLTGLCAVRPPVSTISITASYFLSLGGEKFSLKEQYIRQF